MIGKIPNTIRLILLDNISLNITSNPQAFLLFWLAPSGSPMKWSYIILGQEPSTWSYYIKLLYSSLCKIYPATGP